MRYPSARHALMFLMIVLVTIAIDLLTKIWALSYLFPTGRVIIVTPFLNFAPVWNPGISFGLFADHTEIVSVMIPLLAVFISLWLFFSLAQISFAQRIGAGFIAGGALGNVIDRIRFGQVVDFIDLHWQNYHWPAFNIADSALFIGVILWLYGIIYASEVSKSV